MMESARHKEKTEKTGLRRKYFVLKPSGTDAYAEASRMAMREYARRIDATNPELAEGLIDWAGTEGALSFNARHEAAATEVQEAPSIAAKKLAESISRIEKRLASVNGRISELEWRVQVKPIVTEKQQGDDEACDPA